MKGTGSWRARAGALALAFATPALGCAGKAAPSGIDRTESADSGMLPGIGALPDSGMLPNPSDPNGPALCTETPPVLQPNGTVVTFQTIPFLDGHVMIYGQSNALSGGGTLVPLNFRFYISKVGLVRADGSLVPVDSVTADGTLEPYGIHLFNAEDAQSTAWSIRAPTGSYTGINLTLGVYDVCNVNTLSGRVGPLSYESQMTWPPPFGYLFLRFEASLGGPIAGAGPTNGSVDVGGGEFVVAAIAMGGDVGRLSAPMVHVEGPLTATGTGPITRHLRLDMQQVFKGATANVDVSQVILPPPPGGDELIAGERLRQTVPHLPLFVLDP